MWNKQTVLYFLVMSFFAIGAILQGFIQDWSLLFAGSLLTLVGAILCLLSRQLRIAWLHLGLILYAAAYLITIVYAVDLEGSMIEAGRVALLVPLLGLLLSLDKEKIEAAQLGFTRIAAAVVVLGIAFRMERNDRLESTLEYANALAIILLVAIIVSLLQYARNGKRIEIVVTAILFSGLLLTMSRSVWVLWLASAVAVVLVFSEFRRFKTLIAVGIAHAAGFIVACAYKGDFLFFKGRVQSIQPETSEFKIRFVYWKDGLGMLRDYWWKGTGGGGWSLLQTEYQSKSYFVKYIHNHYVQTALDIGLLGLVLFLFILGMYAFAVWRQLKVGDADDRFWGKGMLIAVLITLFHVGFDFDFTFPLAMGLLLLLMVLSNAYWPVATTIRNKLAANWLGIAAIVVSIAFLWLGIGYREKQTAVQLRDSGQLEASLSHFRSAVRTIPWSPTVRYEFAKAYVLVGNATQNKQAYLDAKQQVEKAIELQPKEALYKDLLKDLQKVAD